MVAIVFIVVGTWLLAAMGLADYRSDVPARWRLLMHMICAALLVAATGGLSVISRGGLSLDLGWVGALGQCIGYTQSLSSIGAGQIKRFVFLSTI